MFRCVNRRERQARPICDARLIDKRDCRQLHAGETRRAPSYRARGELLDLNRFALACFRAPNGAVRTRHDP
jgi:hypothetical protein